MEEWTGVKIRLSGMRANISLKLWENLHGPLRRAYRRVKFEFAFAEPKVLFKVSGKAINDTIGKNDLVPSRIVFGVTPLLPIISSNMPNQKNRMEIVAKGKMEMHVVLAKRGTQTALQNRRT